MDAIRRKMAYKIHASEMIMMGGKSESRQREAERQMRREKSARLKEARQQLVAVIFEIKMAARKSFAAQDNPLEIEIENDLGEAAGDATDKPPKSSTIPSKVPALGFSMPAPTLLMGVPVDLLT
jgi:hypothetical protein